MLNTERGDDDIRGLSYRDAFLPQKAVVLGTFLGHTSPEQFVLIQSGKNSLGLFVVRVVPESLQNLQQDKIANSGRAAEEFGPTTLGESGVSSLDGLWQLLVRAGVFWYAGFAVWTLLF